MSDVTYNCNPRSPLFGNNETNKHYVHCYAPSNLRYECAAGLYRWFFGANFPLSNVPSKFEVEKKARLTKDDCVNEFRLRKTSPFREN